MQSTAAPVSILEEPLSPSEDEHLGADQATEDGSEIKEFKGLYAGTEPAELNKRQTPIASEIFREGSEANQSLEGLQSESTDTYEVGSRYPMDVRVGTTPDDAANSIMKGMASASGSEIPPTYQTDHSGKNEAMDAKLQTKSAADNGSRMPGKGRGDPLDGIIRVRSSSTVDPEVAAGKQRLEGIRQVLGQLEVQAKMNTMAAKIQESTQAVQQPQSAASQVVASTVATPKTNLSKGMTSVNRPGAPTQASVTSTANENGEDTRSFGIALEDIDTPDEPRC